MGGDPHAMPAVVAENQMFLFNLFAHWLKAALSSSMYGKVTVAISIPTHTNLHLNLAGKISNFGGLQ